MLSYSPTHGWLLIDIHASWRRQRDAFIIYNCSRRCDGVMGGLFVSFVDSWEGSQR